jgi:hypothetical protein
MKDDINLNIIRENTPPSDDSLDDPERRELLWEKREETLLHKWQENMIEASKSHFKKAGRLKKLYRCFGLPATLIPISLSGLTGNIQLDPLAVAILLFLSGVLMGVSTFLNFGQKSQMHYDYSTQYNELSKEIEMEICKPKRNRIPCDVFLERVRLKLQYLDASAPV